MVYLLRLRVSLGQSKVPLWVHTFTVRLLADPTGGSTEEAGCVHVLAGDKGTLKALGQRSQGVTPSAHSGDNRSENRRKVGVRMILEVIAAEYFGTNCWIFAQGPGSECIIVDPGMAIPSLVPQIAHVLEKHKLKPIAQLLTHGHLDHTFSVKPLDDGYGVPALIHAMDRPYLGNPWGLLTPDGMIDSILKEMGISSFAEPTSVDEVIDGQRLEIAGFGIKVLHAPGHTPGSTMFLVDDEFLISGDVLFAGSIGRTDLLKGSDAAMRKTLKNVVLPLDDALNVLPGHGKETTIGRERKLNQYLQADYLKGA